MSRYSDAMDKFLSEKSGLFCGENIGVPPAFESYLANRLKIAFETGFNAGVQALKDTMKENASSQIERVQP